MSTMSVKIFERPLMEYPIYKVSFNGVEKFMQRQENMNSGYLWYEVKKTGRTWWYADGKDSIDTRSWLGWTKAEAIEKLVRLY